MAPQLNLSTAYGADEIRAAECLLMLSHGLLRLPSSSASVCVKKIQDSSRPPLPYACNLCNASFNSHQALGGHKTRHRPKTTASTARTLTDHHVVHDCSECHMQFTSQKTLRAHKRKHYEGVIVTAGRNIKSRKISSDIGATVEGGAPRHAGMGLDIDLNLPYIPEFV